MIKFENVVTPSPEQWKALIMGARNAMNSWEKSDSKICPGHNCDTCDFWSLDFSKCSQNYCEGDLVIGPNDHSLMMRLSNAGTDHRKFMRMITVYVDVTAPLYWWKEFDTYKVGTVANSCSTMHKIADKEFTLEDFSCEHLISDWKDDNEKASYFWETNDSCLELFACPLDGLKMIIGLLNANRKAYLETKDKKYWWQMIQLLPSSYNQKRTVQLNYEVLANIYKSRKNHKLDEWSVGFMEWIESLPYSELITGVTK